MNKKSNILMTIVGVVVLSLSACTESPLTEHLPTDDQLLITSYLEQTDSLSDFYKLLHQDGRDIILSTYGNYTAFAPTNKAFEAYLALNGKSDISELTAEETKALVDYHLSMTGITLKALRNGLIPDTTINGLNIFLDLSKGTNHMTLNKVANVLSDATVSNGIVYQIGAVLDPPAGNLYDYLSHSANFSIFKGLMDETGLSDTLQKVKIHHPYSDLSTVFLYPKFTLFAETDDVFKANGITSLGDLKQKVLEKANGIFTNADDALKVFANYHLVSGLKFIYQFYKDQNLSTLALNKTKVIHITGSPDMIDHLPVLNENIGFDYNNSDKLLKNGVIHEIDGVLYPLTGNPPATQVVMECEDGLEFYSTSLGQTPLKTNFDFVNGSVTIVSNQSYSTDKETGTGYALSFTPYDIGGYVEFTIPNVTPGTYQVLFSYHRDRTYGTRNVNVYFRRDTAVFNYKTQLLFTGLDFADPGNVTNDPDYNQNKKLGTIMVNDYGNYTFRFAHTDLNNGVYDNIILQPAN